MSDALARARWFADLGCSVIPIDHPADAASHADPSNVGKTPTVAWKAFQTARPSDQHLSAWFGNGHHRNIGVITGAVSNLVVVDCDSAEAVEWADAHLPRTPWRVLTSKGEHRGYRHPGVPVGNQVRIDTGDPAIKIDVRGDGGYVVAPGSEHVSGARYEWIGEPPSIDALPVFDPEWLALMSPSGAAPTPTLPASVSEGSRNDTLFTEGCRLRRLGLDHPEILATLEAINVRRCRPPLSAQEVETISRSCEKYGKRDAVEEAVEALNSRFGIVSVGNKVVVMENWPDGGIKELWPFEEFKKLLVKERIETGPEGKRKTIPLAKTWLEHRSGRRHGRLVYAMPGAALQLEPDEYNGYLGFTVTPKAGDWSKNRDHVFRIICGGVEALYTWLFNWMAALVQMPGRHAMSAVVLMGEQGVGKGHFAHLMLGALFHKQQYLHIIGAGMLTGQFNEHLSGKVLVFADESTWGGDLRAADKLKGMVTESTVPIERKFLPLVEEPSALHIVIASNNEWPIAIPKDDRRFMVLDVVATERQNDEHFGPLRAELKNGGLAAMLHDLLAHPIDEHALRHPPNTKGKRAVMAQSLKPIEHWWFEKLITGVLLTEDEGWPSQVPKAALHHNYLEFLNNHHTTRAQRSTQTELGRFLKKFVPMVETQRLVLAEGSQQYVWCLPLLENCRRDWVKECGWSEDFSWDEDS